MKNDRVFLVAPAAGGIVEARRTLFWTRMHREVAQPYLDVGINTTSV